MKERGFKGFRSLLSCLVMGQDSWSWLMALRLGDWSSIYMLAHEKALMQRSPFWTAVFKEVESSVLTVDDLQHVAHRNPPSVILLEGDSGYIRCRLATLPRACPCVFILRSGSLRGCKLPGIRWLKMSHSAAGGVSSSRFDVGIRGIEVWDIPKCVERRLGAILSHKEVPQW